MSTPLDRVMRMSWFRSVTDTRPRIRELSLRDLDGHVLAQHSCGDKSVKDARKYLPLFKAGEFSGGREAKDLVSIECIEGDYDQGEHDLDWVVARLMDHGLAAYIYTTSRHEPESPRFRVLCPLSKPRKSADWKRHFDFLNDVLGGTLDPNAAKASQIYFVGALQCGASPEPFHLDSPGLDYIDIALERRTEHPEEGLAQTDPDPDADDDPFRSISLRKAGDQDRIRSMLGHVSPDEHDVWIKVGMILHHELREDGFPIWDEWSSASPNYGETERRWKSFGKRHGRKPLGIGTLTKMAADRGWVDTSLDPDIERMNRKHALVWVKGKALVATFERDGSVSLGQLKDLHAFYENVRVPKPGGGVEAISRKWSRHPQKRMYPDGVTFEPGRETPGKLNLWSGWKVTPDPDTSCKLFLDHVRKIICAGDKAGSDYVIGWLAHLVQRPWEIPGVALVLKGEKGVGKDTFVDYLVPLVGEQHVPTVSQQQHVTGRFNARLENALILHLQEGIWGGDRRAEQVLKYLTTSGRLEIERKGVDSYGASSCLRIVISGNADWMIPASADERRFAVFSVSSAKQRNAEYFKALRKEMESGGHSALLHYLQNYDISKFNVRQPPETKGLLEQKLESLRGVERWWYECIAAGEIIPATSMGTGTLEEAEWELAPIAISKVELRESFTTWLRSRRYHGDPLDDVAFSKSIFRLAPSTKAKRPRVDGRRRWDFVLPALQTAREELERRLGHSIDWAD